MATSRVIAVDGVSLQLVLVRKAVKNVNARLVGQCLLVSAPPHLADEELYPLVAALARRLLRRRRACEVNGEAAAAQVVRRVAATFPSPPPVRSVAFVTTQTRRWGSYSARTGTVRLNAALLLMPRWVLEAVVAHELAHGFHPHHGAAFRTLLHQVCPAIDRANAFLAGVSWLAHRWSGLPPVEKGLLAGVHPHPPSADAPEGKPGGGAGDGGER